MSLKQLNSIVVDDAHAPDLAQLPEKEANSRPETSFHHDLDPALIQELNKPEENKSQNKFGSLMNPKYRLFSYLVASAGHLFAFATKALGMSDENQKKIDHFSLVFSKLVHSIAYGSLSLEAFKDHRTLDGISKILDPLISNFSEIENMNLSKGIAGGLNIIDFAQTQHTDKVSGIWNNLQRSLKVAKDMAKDIYKNGFFNEKRKIFLSPEQERGHSLAFSGHIVLASSIIGLLFKPVEKFANLIRNLGAVISNSVTMYHPDPQKRISGTLFNIYAALDSTQKFMPKAFADMINNVNMAIYNIAIFMYGNLSHKRTENDFKAYE